MRGSALKEILKQQNMTVSELARRVEVPQQTLYSMIKRDNQKVDFDLMMRICAELNVPVESMSESASTPSMPCGEELELVMRYRRLDSQGKSLTNLVIDHELQRLNEALPEESLETKIIPLYLTPAAAGYASPALDDDYVDYSVPADSRADFAVKIDGDSMEPYIADGSVVMCKRGTAIKDGDVGLFFVDGDMKCKQYCQDYAGNVYLFSANRQRSDADVEIKASSGIMLMCFGKVLLEKSIPLPI